MTKSLTFLSVLFILSGCVSKKKYAELQAENQRLEASSPIQDAAKAKEATRMDDMLMQFQEVKERNEEMERKIEEFRMMKEAGEMKEPTPEQMEAYRVKNEQAMMEAEQARIENESERMLEKVYTDGEFVLKVVEAALQEATTGYTNKQIAIQNQSGRLYLSIDAAELFEDDKSAISSNGNSLLNKLSVVLNLQQPMNYRIIGVVEDSENIKQAAGRAVAVQQFFQVLPEPGHPANSIGMTTCKRSRGPKSPGCERIDFIFEHEYQMIMSEVNNSIRR